MLTTVNMTCIELRWATADEREVLGNSKLDLEAIGVSRLVRA